MLSAGTILDDRYEVIDVVGTGGMSTVYRAMDERLQRYVAIKVLNSSYSGDQNFVAKFRAEAQSTAGLTHPNIVSVYDVCEDKGRYFIVMELVEGITLKEYISLNGRLSMDQAIDFSLQIASGLQTAHEHHIIHRDIKPQNIIVSKTGNIKVTDFGIAKAATSTTMSTAGIGSVHYISPEQARGGYSDERSDIYSLGITMYEMITGRVPFEGDTNVAIALMHIQNEMIPPRQIHPDIYPSLEKIVMKATQKKPERRYLKVAALIADLNRVKENPNIDIIVAPGLTGGPTKKFSAEDMKKIKDVSNNKPMYDASDIGITAAELGYETPSEIERKKFTADSAMEEIDKIIQDSEDDYYEEEEEETPRPVKKKQSLKKVEDDEEDYVDTDDEDDDDDGDNIDPKLEKAVMFGGIAVAVIIAIIIFVVVGQFMGWFKFASKSEEETTTATTEVVTVETTTQVATKDMISVVGLSESAAEKELSGAGFTNYTFTRVNSTDTPEGYVISQSIDRGTTIPVDSSIIIEVSAGAEEIEVPDVVNEYEDTADETLKNAGFKVTHSYENSDVVEKDVVISQSPNGGDMAKAGDIIELVISLGKEEKEVEVPNILGLTENNAKSTLETNGLTVNSITYDYSNDVPEGQVMTQSIAASTIVKEGTSVDFVVSYGPETKTYQGAVSGSISTSDAEFIEANTVTVYVYINDADGYHEISSATAGAGQSGTLYINNSLSGLNYNNGTLSFTVTDGEGNDVTSKYAQSLTLSYTEE